MFGRCTVSSGKCSSLTVHGAIVTSWGHRDFTASVYSAPHTILNCICITEMFKNGHFVLNNPGQNNILFCS